MSSISRAGTLAGAAPASRTAGRVRRLLADGRVRTWLAITAFWVVLGALQVMDLLTQPKGGIAIPRPLVFVIGAADTASWLVLTLGGYEVVRRYPVWSRRRKHVAVFVAAAVVCSILRSAMLSATVPVEPPFLMSLRLRFIKDLVGFLSVLGTCAGIEAFRDARERERRTLQLAAHLAEARLTLLKGQLQPHFLFNTLNSISSLVRTDPAGAQRVVVRLGEMLRSTLNLRDLHEVMLGEELELLAPYREIQHVRFGDRVRMEVKIEPAVQKALVPHLLLQPMVENAFEHGAAQLARDGLVRVRAWATDAGLLHVRVEDNGPGFSGSAMPGGRRGNGMALANTRQRLQQLYGDLATLRAFDGTDSGELCGAIVEIVVPLRLAPEPAGAGPAWPSPAPPPRAGVDAAVRVG